MNSGIEPATGTCSMPFTTTNSDTVAATRITSPLAQTFAIAISKAVSGITIRCSRVPCSRSRIRAAPVRITVSSVIWLMMATIPLNQLVSPLGLKALRITSRIGPWSLASERTR